MAVDRIELSNPNAYIEKMQRLTGGRDPFEIMAETPRVLADLVRSAPADVLRRRPHAGKWTPLEVMGHLVDTEFTFGYRFRTIFCDDQPQLIGMDQEKWAIAQKHNERDPAELADNFAALRRINLRFYRSIPKEAYDRFGQHNERGPESIGMMLSYCAGHDLSHIDQLKRYLAAAKEMK
jgi:hypothetical protein